MHFNWDPHICAFLLRINGSFSMHQIHNNLRFNRRAFASKTYASFLIVVMYIFIINDVIKLRLFDAVWYPFVLVYCIWIRIHAINFAHKTMSERIICHILCCKRIPLASKLNICCHYRIFSQCIFICSYLQIFIADVCTYKAHTNGRRSTLKTNIIPHAISCIFIYPHIIWFW